MHPHTIQSHHRHHPIYDFYFHHTPMHRLEWSLACIMPQQPYSYLQSDTMQSVHVTTYATGTPCYHPLAPNPNHGYFFFNKNGGTTTTRVDTYPCIMHIFIHTYSQDLSTIPYIAQRWFIFMHDLSMGRLEWSPISCLRINIHTHLFKTVHYPAPLIQNKVCYHTPTPKP